MQGKTTMEEYRSTFTTENTLMALVILILVGVIGLWLYPDCQGPAAYFNLGEAVPLPTLMATATPPLTLPQPTPALLRPVPTAAIYIDNSGGGNVTINQTNVDIDVCILARCP
jgi:hypothetical protein